MEKTISAQQYKNAIKLIELFKIEQNGVPHPLEVPDYQKLKETTKKYITLLQKGIIGDDDFKQEIFTIAMETIFGNEIWSWVNKHIKTRK